MNASQFMDKQITALSAQGGGGDLLDLLNSQQQEDRNRHSNGDGGKKEEIVPSYDFQPIRSAAPPAPSFQLEGPRGPTWGSLDSKSNLRNYTSLEMNESTRTIPERSKEAYDVDIVAEIDRTVKKHTDILLSALESVSSRLAQLESRTHHLDSSVDDLKFAMANNSGSTDGKLRQLENIMRELQAGVQILRDKHEIMEAQLHLSKLQASSGDQQTSSTVQVEPQQQPVLPPPPQQPSQPPVAPPQQPTVPAPTPTNLAPTVPPQQNPPAPYPIQVAPNQMLPAPQQPYAQPQDPPQPYQPSIQQPPPPSGAPPPQLSSQPPPQPYQIPPQLPPYAPPPQAPQHPPQFTPHPEEAPSYPHSSQQYPPTVRPLTSGPPPQFYGSVPNVYETPTSKPIPPQAPYSAGYAPPHGPGFKEPYPYGAPASHHPSKPAPYSSSGPQSGGSNYPRLPTAQLLPQAVPTGSGSSGPAGNRVPLDDVVERVTTMGFSRDQVRATVRKLTENGQSVDLNVVLDKLMNGGDIQPQKNWYGR